MAEKKINPWVKIGLEIGPVIAFFVAFARMKDQSFTIGATTYDGFIVATAAFIPLMIASTAILWWLTGKLAPMQIVTVVLVVVFGGLSVWFNDKHFFKMKPTIIYLVFAGILGWGLLRGKSYLALVMDEVMPLTHEGWMILTRRLTGFFLALAVLNEIIWRTMSDQAWVNFKTFGLTAAIFVFFIAQGGLMRRHGTGDDRSGDGET